MTAAIKDAAERSRTIIIGLNKEWIRKQRGYFLLNLRSILLPQNSFLCNYKSGKYCALAQVIELVPVEYYKLFSILRTDPPIEVLIHPSVIAFLNEAMKQLEGQISNIR